MPERDLLTDVRIWMATGYVMGIGSLGYSIACYIKQRSLEEQKRAIDKSGQVFEISDLVEMQKSGTSQDIIEGEQYCLISGLLVKPNALQEKNNKPYLYKALAGSTREDKSKLLKFTGVQHAYGDGTKTKPFRFSRYLSAELTECFLVDETQKNFASFGTQGVPRHLIKLDAIDGILPDTVDSLISKRKEVTQIVNS